MRVRKNQRAVKLPPMGLLHSVSINSGQIEFVLYQLYPNSKLSDLNARPTAFIVNGDKLMLSPIPDKSYKINIRYYPPIQVI